MIQHISPKNLFAVWDLTPEEVEKYYRGNGGRATVVLDDQNNILECHYWQLGPLPDEDEEQAYIKPASLTAPHQLDGIMSCNQFCEV